MKKLMAIVKKTKNEIKSINFEEIKKAEAKSHFYTFVMTIIILIPFVLIFVEAFKQYSIITPMFYWLLGIIFIGIYMFLPVTTIIFFELLKNYTEREDVKALKASNLYIMELLNPLHIILPLIVVLTIYFGVRMI